jgi:tetratricopeptide (TPR) repeat protein
MLFALNMWEQSIFFINKSIEIHGEHEILHFLAGKAYQSIGQIEEAYQCMKRAKAMSDELDAVNESLKELEIVLRERKLTSNLFYA